MIKKEYCSRCGFEFPKSPLLKKYEKYCLKNGKEYCYQCYRNSMVKYSKDIIKLNHRR